MSSKYCSACVRKLPLSSFLKDALSSPSSRVYSTCIQCRGQKKASSRKRATLRSLDPNIQPAKRVRCSNTGPQPVIQAPLLPNLPVEPPPLNPPTEPLPPQAPVTALPPLDPPIEPLPRAPVTALPPLDPPLEPQPQAPVTDRPPTEPIGFLPTDEWQRIHDFNRAIEDIQIETC